MLSWSLIFAPKITDHEQCIKFSEETINIDPNLAGAFQI